jgi:hypothetical protein
MLAVPQRYTCYISHRDYRYESVAKGQLVPPSLSQHAVVPKQVLALSRAC